jgi:transposase
MSTAAAQTEVPAPILPLDSPPDDAHPVDVQVISPYGVGIDTHSKFIQVCVMYQHPQPGGNVTVRQREKEFSTHWHDLIAAKLWVLGILGPKADPDTLRYCIESTGTYHLPVLKAFGGIPSVVNPLLAGASHRKTDVLDARTLAHHSITGLWKASFIPTQQAQILRVLWARRREMTRRATRAANQLNNIVLRFGFTFGADVSMRSIQAENILSDLIDGAPVSVPGAPPDGLPPEVRPVISALLKDLRSDLNEAHHATVASENFIKSRDWPIAPPDTPDPPTPIHHVSRFTPHVSRFPHHESRITHHAPLAPRTSPLSPRTIPGTDLLALLRTVPGVGENTALTWLSEITDPRRFQNAKQVAAFAGCDPSLKISAGKVTSYVRRQGNLRLHQALLYAASGLLRRTDDPLGNWGRSIAGRHKKGGHKKACGAIARRLACGLWEVHRRGQPWSYDQYTLAQKIVCPLTPLGTLLPRKAVLVLRSAGIRNSHQLAAAYNDGKLAAIQGFGDTSIRAVKQWVLRTSKPIRPNAPNPNPNPNPQSLSEAVPSGTGKPKTYVLSPSLAFKKERRRKVSNDQDTQTSTGHPASRQGKDAFHRVPGIPARVTTRRAAGPAARARATARSTQ